MAEIAGSDAQMEMRRRAAAVAAGLSDRGVAGWLAESTEKGVPADDRFESVFAEYRPSREKADGLAAG